MRVIADTGIVLLLLLCAEKGGNPEIVRESQKRRYADVGLVDKVVALDADWRSGELLVFVFGCVVWWVGAEGDQRAFAAGASSYAGVTRNSKTAIAVTASLPRCCTCHNTHIPPCSPL